MKILQCPFCGSRRIRIRKTASNDVHLRCTKCGAYGEQYTKPKPCIKWYLYQVED